MYPDGKSRSVTWYCRKSRKSLSLSSTTTSANSVFTHRLSRWSPTWASFGWRESIISKSSPPTATVSKVSSSIRSDCSFTQPFASHLRQFTTVSYFIARFHMLPAGQVRLCEHGVRLCRNNICVVHFCIHICPRVHICSTSYDNDPFSCSTLSTPLNVRKTQQGTNTPHLLY